MFVLKIVIFELIFNVKTNTYMHGIPLSEYPLTINQSINQLITFLHYKVW